MISKIKDISIIIFFLSLSYVIVDMSIFGKMWMNNVQTELQKSNLILQRELVFWRVDTQKLMDSHLKTLEVSTNQQLTTFNSNLKDSLNVVTANTTTVAENTTRITNEFEVTSKDYRVLQADVRNRIKLFDPQLDCETNDFCWQNLATDTMIASRDMSFNGSKAFIDVSKNVSLWSKDMTTISNTLAVGIPKVTDNVADITLNVKKMTTKKWYDKLIGWGLSGALAYATAK